MPPKSYSEEEISLRDLFATLWRGKVLILTITASMTILTASYAFLATPVYRTEAVVRPPFLYETAHYRRIVDTINANSVQADAGLLAESPTDIHQRFLRQIHLTAIRRNFFEKIYLPDHPDAKTTLAKAHLWNQLDQNLTVSEAPDSKNTMPIEKISLQDTAPDKMAGWLNQYIEITDQASRQVLASDLEQIRQASVRSIDARIEALRETAAAKRLTTLAQLNDALKIAEATHIVTPLSPDNLVASYEGATKFLRGSKALQAEIDILKTRTADDPYIVELPALLHARTQLENLDIRPDLLTIAVIDQTASPPGPPIKPQRTLIVILGAALGLILGTLAALACRKTSRPPHSAVSP